MKREGPAIDLSPRAVGQRIDELAAMYRLWLSLRQARLIGTAAEQPASPPQTEPDG